MDSKDFYNVIEILTNTKVLTDSKVREIVTGYIEVFGLDNFINLTIDNPEHWIDNLGFYPRYTYEDYANMLMEQENINIPYQVLDYINYKEFVEDQIDVSAYITPHGILEIRNN